MDYISNYNKIIETLVSDKGEAYFLSNEEDLTKFFERFKSAPSEDDFSKCMVSQTSGFSRDKKPIVSKYLNGEIELSVIANAFIKYIFENGLDKNITKEMVMQTLGNALVDNSDYTVKDVLKNHSFQKTIDMFGFGLGDGSYEAQIKSFLIQQGLVDKAHLYGYDPFPVKTEAVDFISAKALLSEGEPGFDLIVARWALHHVPNEQRWKLFGKVLKRLKSDSLAIIVEHAYVDKSNEPSFQKIVRLFNAFLDIIANVGIRPEWFRSTKPDYGKNFFINFLSSDDLEIISSSCERNLKVEIVSTGPRFPWQSIITFRT